MTPTPERALELAEMVAGIKADYAGGARICAISALDCEALHAILRHYAEIAPRWQAVLDAEPVAYQFEGGWASPSRTNKFDYHEGQGPIGGGHPLIIKPTP